MRSSLPSLAAASLVRGAGAAGRGAGARRRRPRRSRHAGGAATPAAAGAAEPQGFTYNPEGRRDPFVSLVRRGVEPLGAAGRRPAGLGGLGDRRSDAARHVSEPRRLRRAFCRAPTARPTSCAPASGCSTARSASITADAMVILQQVNDPLSLEKQREVRKVLRQTEEAK